MALVKKISELVISASPMLQAIFQLFNTSLTLILRPIGDFIGFLLRPIMVYILQNVAIPFYRYFTPWMQKYGNSIGEGIISLVKILGIGTKAPTFNSNPVNNILVSMSPITLSAALTPSVKKLGTDFADQINKQLDPLKTSLGALSEVFSVVGTVLLPAWDKFYNFFIGISNGTITVATIWSSFIGFFNLLYKDLNGTVFNAWAEVESFFNTLLKDVTTVLQPIWTVFMNFWNAIQTFLKNIGNFISNPLGALSNSGSTVTKTVGSVEQSIQSAAGVAIQNLNITGLQLGTDATMLLKDPIGYITKAIQTVNSKAVAR